MPARSRLRTLLRWAARVGAAVLALVLVGASAVYALSERRARVRFAVPAHPLAVPDDAAAVERGRHLATVRGCVGCHGEGLAGRVEMDEPAIGRLAGPNLTRGGRGAALTPADWERSVRHGVRRDGTPLLFMPSNEHSGMSDEDLGAIVAYARSLPADTSTPPASRAGPVLRAMVAAGKLSVFPAESIDHARPHPQRVAAEPTVAYGAYLATMCTGCHGPGLSGGKIPGAPPGWRPASNITRAGIGGWSEADFARALRAGQRPDGTPIDSLMPVRLTKHMTDVELRALYAFLRTVPPKPYGNR